MSSQNPVEVVTEFLRAFERFELDAMPPLMDDQVRLLLPTAPAGVEREFVGKDAFTAFLDQVKLVWKKLTLVTLEVHPFGDDPTRVLAEYSSNGQNVDGSVYENTYATLIQVQNGKITVFQEFFDPVPLANAMSLLAAQADSV